MRQGFINLGDGKNNIQMTITQAPRLECKLLEGRDFVLGIPITLHGAQHRVHTQQMMLNT